MEVTLQAEGRASSGKGVARKLRAAGKVPGILYGRGVEATPVAVDARNLSRALHTEAGRNVLIDLELNGESHLTMFREIQRDPLRGDLRHVDFLRIDRHTAVEVDVPVHVAGEAPGQKEGGALETHLFQVRVSCLPTSVPERIDADVSRLAIGDQIRVGDITPPEGVTILTGADELVVSCVVPQELEVEPVLEVPEEEVAAEAAEAAEGEEAAAPAGEAAGEPADKADKE